MAGPAVNGSILRRSRNKHNYAVLNRCGFSTIKTVRTKKIIKRNRNNSMPNSPDNVTNIDTISDTISQESKTSACSSDFGTKNNKGANVLNHNGTTATNKNRHILNSQRNLSDMFVEMATPDATGLSKEECKQHIRDDIARL